jgi:hypothetical protein
MSEALLSLIPGPNHLSEKPPILEEQAVVPAKPDTTFLPEQTETVDTFFAHDKDKLPMVGLMGAYSAGMMLNDMLEEHLKRSEEEEEDERGNPKSPRLPDDE